jgi:hypothetical protein
MFSIANLIIRLVPIIFGLLLAFLAAGLFLGYGFYSNVIDPAFEIDPQLRHDGFIVFVTGLAWSPFIAIAALGPAAIIIAIAEILNLRSLIANVLAGGLVSLIAFWSSSQASSFNGLSDGPLIVVTATGFIGGFVYWLVAGRKAGRWLVTPGSV